MSFDLGAYNFNDPMPAAPVKPVDTSGKPYPTSATLITADGYRLAADIVFDGVDADGDRRYMLMVESDWLTLRLAAVELDKHPNDVSVVFKMVGDFDSDRHLQLQQVLHTIQWVVGTVTQGAPEIKNYLPRRI